MKLYFWVLAALGIGLVLWVRSAKDDPLVWHVDPLTVVEGGKPNQYLMLPNGKTSQSPVFKASTLELAGAFDRVAMGQPRVSRLAGSVEELWVTYVQRTALMRFPDYISVKVIGNTGGSATLAIYSRSRFGRSDFGVNRARVNMWIKALGQMLVAR
ncbi:MAG: DUF1499 domain-containing protein [Rhodobacteraceae bacterium]|nr:DUF1499 domain-containing protein [Paracoccaceae bacterium]